MSNGNFEVGSTFLFPGTHQNPDNLHLCIVVTPPIAQEGDTLLFVPVITMRDDFADVTCILDVGDHPFIVRTSVVDYRRIFQRSVMQLERMLEMGDLHLRGQVSTAVLARVQEGVMVSDHTPRFAVSFMQKHG